jgi:recombinational DNA repair ATPase RecF
LKWEEPSRVAEQVRVYKKLLRPRNAALVSLKTVDPMLKAQLKTLGVTIFENFADEAVQAEFKRYVVKALM